MWRQGRGQRRAIIAIDKKPRVNRELRPVRHTHPLYASPVRAHLQMRRVVAAPAYPGVAIF